MLLSVQLQHFHWEGNNFNTYRACEIEERNHNYEGKIHAGIILQVYALEWEYPSCLWKLWCFLKWLNHFKNCNSVNFSEEGSCQWNWNMENFDGERKYSCRFLSHNFVFKWRHLNELWFKFGDFHLHRLRTFLFSRET